MAKAKKSSEDDDLLRAALDDFQACEDAESTNRESALNDITFSRLGEQWPADVAKQRQVEGRPCLTINKLPTFIRQVVNDARQNKPSIKVHAADSGADPATAELINGLIRNIEYTSNADTAYDTGAECAVTGGFGYWRVSMDYAYDDAFDMDLLIKRVSNPFSIYGDPNSREADSSDWDKAFVVDQLSKAQFESQWGDKAQVDWDDESWSAMAGTSWRDGDYVTIAEWWTREEVERPIVQLSDGSVHDMEDMQSEQMQFLLSTGQIQVVRERKAKSCKVTQRFMSGAEILETREWPGRYIPIVPVYGDEFDVEGKRFLRSLVHNGIDSQRMYNYWRTNATELVALAPKVPFIGPKNAFNSDQDKWNTANTKSHPYMEYDGQVPPQRQPMDTGAAAGSLQEAMNANDDIKATIGLFDASLGARSNETSGRAIMARQREGDVSTFHFVDNKNRAIRHTGRILIDLIPKVYTGERMIRIIGEDGTQEAKPINQQYPQTDPKTGQPVVDEQGQAIMAMHDLTAGKYDLTVTTGPSFTSRREEAAASMTEMVRAFPAAAPIIMPELAKQLDWPGADKIADKMEEMASGQVPPELQKQMQEMQAQMQKLAQENQQLKQDQSTKIAEIQADQQIQMLKVQSEEKIAAAKIQSQQQVEFYKAQTQAAIAAAKPKPNGQSAQG